MRRKSGCFFWGIEKKLIGLALIFIGVLILGIILLPFRAWLVIVGCILIYIGYCLFC